MRNHRKADPGELQELYSFFNTIKDSRAVTTNVIHNWEGAIGAIAHCLSPEEKTIGYLNDNLESLRSRMKQSQLNISSSTIDSYINRAASAISYYQVWRNEPGRWQNEIASTPRKSFPKLSYTSYPSTTNLAAKKPENLTHSFGSKPKNRIQLRADGGDFFIIEFPEQFFMKDVLRVIWALAAHARDFDYKELLQKIWSD